MCVCEIFNCGQYQATNMTSPNSELGRNMQQHVFISYSHHIGAGDGNDPKSVPESKMQWNNYEIISCKHFLPFKSIIYLILNLYNLIASNCCFQQPACKIPRTITVCFCGPAWADSSTHCLPLYLPLGFSYFPILIQVLPCLCLFIYFFPIIN